MTRRSPRLAVALDVEDLSTARGWMAEVADSADFFKVGLELFTSEGPDAVRAVRQTGARCFLDLKLHDIPATMARATAAASRLGATLLTVHAAAGPEALAAAAEAAGSELRLLAVTVLTSLEARTLQQMGWSGTPQDIAARLAEVALRAGIDGLVCSGHEAASLRRRFGEEPLLVVPGIRPAGSARGDQRRVCSPAEAVRAGADVLVVGRPIRCAADPAAAARAVLAEARRAAHLERAEPSEPGP